MIIYLLRHGIAVQRGTATFPNDDRPLTDDGRKKMKKGAEGMVRFLETIDLILTSPLSRAHETAKIVADALGVETKLEIAPQLSPGSSVKQLLLYLAKFKQLNSIMIVGHEPDLGYLASSLLGSEYPIIEFKKGALCCIEVSGLPLRGHGTLLWHLQSKHLRSLK